MCDAGSFRTTGRPGPRHWSHPETRKASDGTPSEAPTDRAALWFCPFRVGRGQVSPAPIRAGIARGSGEIRRARACASARRTLGPLDRNRRPYTVWYPFRHPQLRPSRACRAMTQQYHGAGYLRPRNDGLRRGRNRAGPARCGDLGPAPWDRVRSATVVEETRLERSHFLSFSRSSRSQSGRVVQPRVVMLHGPSIKLDDRDENSITGAYRPARYKSTTRAAIQTVGGETRSAGPWQGFCRMRRAANRIRPGAEQTARAGFRVRGKTHV
jgi:hypothetical protein